MKISRITVYQINLPLTKPYYLSGGRLRFDKLDSTFVKIDTDEGLSGWGEGCPWGHTYLPAHGPGIRAGIETLAPAVLGQDPCALEALNRTMDTQLPGHPYVKSAIDMAAWDILGQQAGLPLWKLMGGADATPVAVNSSISTGSPEGMIALIRDAYAKGYRVHSAKIGGTDLNMDRARIEAIEDALHDDEAVTFDVNRAWTPSAAISVLNSVQSRSWVEQPCETLDECTHVASRVHQPIMLDECMHTFGDHLQAWKRGSCEGVKVKPNRVGGLTRAKQIRDFGVSVGWAMHIEDLGGSAMADTAAIHLAVDPVPGQGSRNIDGFVIPPNTPGLGVQPDLNVLGEPIAIYE